MRRIFLQSLAVPAVQILFDLALRALWESKGGSKFSAGVYAVGLFACWALSFAFTAIPALLRRAGRTPAAIATGLFAAAHTTILTCNFFTFQYFGEYIFPGSLAFLFDPAYMADYVRTVGGPGPVALILILWASFFACLFPWGNPPVRFRFLVPALAVVLAGGVAALQANEKKSEYRMPPDVVAAESLSKHFLRVRDKIWPLRPAKRLPVIAPASPRPAADSRPPTVLVIIHESMGTRSLPFFEGVSNHAGSAGGLPRLAARMRRDSGSFFVLQRAYTNAVATQVSMSAIFSGASPEESHRKLHCTPMLWDLAKAAGYRTAYFTPQRLRWATLNDFLLNEPIDTVVSRENTDFPPANDIGIDDFHIVGAIESWVAAHPREPLFIVWNTNALHAPFQETSEFVDLSGVEGGRYEKALHLVDTAMARVFAVLEKAGRMDGAVVISTADHGEDPEPAHPIARINSYYEEFLRIPLWVRLPPSLAQGAAGAGLRARLRSPVANIDIAPTLAGLWRLAPGNPGPDLPKECVVPGRKFPWIGQDLFDPDPPRDRVIVALSTNDIRHWEGQGFGLVHGPWRMVLWPDSGRNLFNIDADPGQVRNLWGAVPDSVMRPFRRRIEESAWLRRIHAHHAKREAQ